MGRRKQELTPNSSLMVVLRCLTAAAEAHETCPTNDALAVAIQASAVAASDLVRRLERRGLIKVQRGNCTRVVTVLSTGKRTLGQVTAPHWRERNGPPPIAPVQQKLVGMTYPERQIFNAARDAEIEERRIARDPCVRCAVRKDIHAEHGCKRFIHE